MHGSLAFENGVLYVGRYAKTAHVSWYDLDGHQLSEGFSYRDPRHNHATASGLAVDADRRIWVADTPADRVRCFNLFGNEIGGLGGEAAGDRDEPGVISRPVAVAARGGSEDLVLAVAMGGVRRHAVQLFDARGRLTRSLRPKGDPHGSFRYVRSVAALGRFLYVCEGGWGCVQVFRDGDFHFAFRPVPDRSLENAAGSEPRALAPLPDGRLVVACGSAHGGDHGGGGLMLFDRAGRLLRTLAEAGAGEGRVFEPGGVVVRPASSDRETRVAVLDRDGDRVQVFTLEGRCYGAFDGLAG